MCSSIARFFFLTPEQTTALLADLEDPSAAALACARLSPSERSISWKASTAATPL